MESNSVATVNLSPERESSLRTVGHISYALHAIVAVAAVLPGAQVSVLLLVAAFILDLVKRDDAAGSWQESHFRWRIRSVIWAAVLYVVTIPLWLLLLAARLDRLGRDLDLVPVPGGARLAGAERPQSRCRCRTRSVACTPIRTASSARSSPGRSRRRRSTKTTRSSPFTTSTRGRRCTSC